MKKKSFKGGILLATVLLFVRLLTSASNVFAADDEYDPYGGVSYKAYDTYARVETIDPGPGILGDIHIRDTYNGKPVTYIQWNALFRYSTYPQANVKLRSITFPDTLSVVENRLFDGCTNLISVKANNLTVIGGEGFRNCFALKDIDISKVKSIYNQGFYNCKSLTSITIPECMWKIWPDAFSYCTALRTVTFPNSNVVLDPTAFVGCTDITVYGYKNTTGYEFAMANNFKFVSLANATVTYNSQGGTAIPSETVMMNDTLKNNATPTRTGYKFGGWYTEATCVNSWATIAFDGVTKDITLYAKWINLAAPAAVTNVKAVSSSAISIKVTWNTVSGANGYELYRSTSSNGTFNLVARVTSSYYNNVGLTIDDYYYYKVKSYKNVGGVSINSDWSNIAVEKPILTLVTGVKAVSTSYNSIKVTWNTVPGASGYLVYRYSPSDEYKLTATTTIPSYNNSGLTTGSTYHYTIMAYTDKIDTDSDIGTRRIYGPNWSGYVSAKVVLSPVTNVKSTSSSYSSINTTWKAVAGASGYEVFRSNTYNGTYTMVARLNALKFNNGGLTTGRGYYYKVRSYRNVGSTKVYSNYWSNLGYAKVVPSPVTNVKAIRASSKSIRITWNKVVGVSGYEVYRSTSNNGTYGIVARTSSAYSYYNNGGLTTGRTYYYKVRSYRTVGTTKIYCNYWSNISYAKPY